MKRHVGVASAVAILATASLNFCQTKSEYFIIVDPAVYTIYNQYEQPIAASEKGDFAACAPLRVMDQDVVLGDQITHALKFGLDGKTFFLIKGDDKKFSGEKSRAGRQSIKECEVIEDTVEAAGSGLRYTTISGKSFLIEKGVRVHRIFKSGGRFYIRTDGRYGWSPLEPRSAWRKIASVKAVAVSAGSDTGMTEAIRNRILTRFASANESYTKMFSHFNSFSGDGKSIPRWSCGFSASRCLCTLGEPYKTGDELYESTAALVHDLENLLLGTRFRVRQASGEIVIEKR